MNKWYTLESDDVLQRLGVNRESGLSDSEILRRRGEYGVNELVERGLKSPLKIFWEQLTSTMVLILIFAAVISTLLGDYKDAVAIIAIVILNALLGFTQEYNAEKAIAALRRLAVPIVKVKRGNIKEISSKELVPGDIVMLEAGNIVPADCRLLESANLRVQESSLTGESEPVEKDSSIIIESDQPLGDRRNMAYMGTTITGGRGQAVITEIGMKTELGNIAEMIQKVGQEQTPFQRRLSSLGNRILIAISVLVAIIFILGLLRGEEIKLMLMMAVSMAVAAVPEALPAVVTITLALGAQRMLKRRALIRKLPAVETLGSVTVICSDKTGTLTENCMTTTVLDIAGDQIDLSDSDCKKELFPLSGDLKPSLYLLLTGSSLCNDAVLNNSEQKSKSVNSVGDPTETALLVAASQFKLQKQRLEELFPRFGEIPFESNRKLMTTIHRIPSSGIPESILKGLNNEPVDGELLSIAFTKGAIDSLLDLSTRVWINDNSEPLTMEKREKIMASHDQITGKGMRVLGVAFRLLGSIQAADIQTENIERELVFIGMIGMIDPARQEVKDAVSTCRTAGIRPVMITGDHPLTALYIARNLSITDNDRIFTGR